MKIGIVTEYYYPTLGGIQEHVHHFARAAREASLGAGWLAVLGTLTHAYGAGYPRYMQSQPFGDKQIQTFLGSFTELKHNTLLYSKQNYSEMGEGGDGPIPPVVKGFVEPNLAFWNKFSALVLTTGNKSEMAVGYCTLYGDMVGALAVIGDLVKTRVYQVCRWINRAGEVIPWAILEKPPSAELRPDQKDTDSLPPYDVLDPILEAYVERYETPEQIARPTDFLSNSSSR